MTGTKAPRMASRSRVPAGRGAPVMNALTHKNAAFLLVPPDRWAKNSTPDATSPTARLITPGR